MPAALGYTVIEDFTGSGSLAAGTIVDEAYGTVVTSAGTYTADGAAFTVAGAGGIDYANELDDHPGPLVVPTGVGARFKPTGRRFDIQIGTDTGWGITAVWGLSPFLWESDDGVFDLDVNLVGYFYSGLGVWYDFALLDTGAWSLSYAGGATILSGSIGAKDSGDWYASLFTSSIIIGEDPGGTFEVDRIWLYGVDALPPYTRLHPRDDALGMSSAPRQWPIQKAARIIGGTP